MDLKAAIDVAHDAMHEANTPDAWTLGPVTVPFGHFAAVAVRAAAPLIEAAARADERAKLMADRCHLSARCPRCGCTGPDIWAPTKGFCSHCEDWPAKGIVGGRAEPPRVSPATDSSPDLPLVRCLRCDHPLGECVCQNDKAFWRSQ